MAALVFDLLLPVPKGVSHTAELVGHERSVAFLPYGDEVRYQRRMVGLHLGPRAVADTPHSALHLSVRQLLVNLFGRPQELQGQIYHSIVMANLKYAVMSTPAAEIFGEVVAGQLPAVLFPVLRYIPAWLPGASIQARFARCKEVTQELGNVAFEKVKRDFAQGGAFDPAELDAVVGPGRLSSFGDRNKLVYIKAFIKEALRWHVVSPVGVAHETIEDDDFHGHTMHDPDLYEELFEFRPERFLGDEPARE
ncbi:cytochrome P450 [Trametes elegans]|nr:cytochrome P450 [Trametes elegans]